MTGSAKGPRYVSDAMLVYDLQRHGGSTRAQIVERHPSWAALGINGVLKRCKRRGHIVRKDGLWTSVLPAKQVRLTANWATKRHIIVQQKSGANAGYVVLEPEELAKHLEGRVLPSRDAVCWEAENLLSKCWNNPGRNQNLTTGWG